jgi:hypothetical protein
MEDKGLHLFSATHLTAIFTNGLTDQLRNSANAAIKDTGRPPRQIQSKGRKESITIRRRGLGGNKQLGVDETREGLIVIQPMPLQPLSHRHRSKTEEPDILDPGQKTGAKGKNLPLPPLTIESEQTFRQLPETIGQLRLFLQKPPAFRKLLEQRAPGRIKG